jgi:hypothetical protein
MNPTKKKVSISNSSEKEQPVPDRLNFFEPYESLLPSHENQLTRALLVVLRYCPIAHQAWLSLIDPGKQLLALPHPTFSTQRAQILQENCGKPTDEPISGISVICAADAPAAASEVVQSDRGQVLDGIIRYENDLVIVLESKLDGPVTSLQATNINLHGQPVRFEENVHAISWRQILLVFDAFANEERGLTAGAERIILQDFLTFVDRNFPRLGPFNLLRSCAGDPSRLLRRLRAIIDEAQIGGQPTGDSSRVGIILPGQHLTVISAYLVYENGQVVLKMFPADTLEQAREFYGRPKAPQQVSALHSKGWTISPNFHFGYMAKGLCWTKAKASVSVDDYMRYWQNHIRQTRQLDRPDWPTFWNELVKLGFAQKADREQFDNNFTHAKRQFASPRPSIYCGFAWSLGDAEALDSQKKLGATIKERINELLVAVGEPAI